MRDALRHADFRRLFLGRLVTNAGDSLYAVAAMWLVYDLTGSTTYSGLAGFLTFAPQALQFLAGPLVDRWALRRVLVGTQVIQATLVLAVPVAFWFDALTAELVLVVMPLLSLLNQFVYPAQSAALPRLVPKEDLVSANSALSLAYQGTDLVFNALAGVLVAVVGAVSLYLVDSVTFVVAAACFLAIRLPPARDGDDAPDGPTGNPTDEAADAGTAAADGGEQTSAATEYLADLREGIGFVRGTVIAAFIVASVVANASLGATLAVLPAFAALRGGPEVYGMLTAALAAGALVGALLASRFENYGYGTLAIVGFGIGGVAWLGAVAVQWTPATVALFGLAFVPVGVTNVIAASMVQTLVPERLLGRVSAVSTSAAVMMTPVGSLLGGAAGDVVGAGAVVAVGGLGMLFIAVYALSRPKLRTLPPVDEMETLSV